MSAGSVSVLGAGHEETVGYRHPPKHSQFKKGMSGNPAGRKKGARTLNQEVYEALSERVPVIQNGQRRTMTKLRAALTQTFNKAAAGDAKATKLLVELARQSDNDEALKQMIGDAKMLTTPIQIFQLPDNGR